MHLYNAPNAVHITLCIGVHNIKIHSNLSLLSYRLFYRSHIPTTPQCTKQMFSERFGRGSRTVDLELEAQIDLLRDTKSKYENVLHLASSLTSHFYNMVQTQQALGDIFADLSQKSPELQVGLLVNT